MSTCIGCGDSFTPWHTETAGQYIGYYCKPCKADREEGP